MAIFNNLGKLIWRVPEKKPEPKPNPVDTHSHQFHVPKDMDAIEVEILDKNGYTKGSYMITRYVSIRPEDVIRIKVHKK